MNCWSTRKIQVVRKSVERQSCNPKPQFLGEKFHFTLTANVLHTRDRVSHTRYQINVPQNANWAADSLQPVMRFCHKRLADIQSYNAIISDSTLVKIDGGFSFSLQFTMCNVCFLYAIPSWARCVYSTSNFQLIALQHWTQFSRFLHSSHAVVCNNHAPRQCCVDVDRTRAMLRKCFTPDCATRNVQCLQHSELSHDLITRRGEKYFHDFYDISSVIALSRRARSFFFPPSGRVRPFFWFSHPQTSSFCRLCGNFTVAVAALENYPILIIISRHSQLKRVNFKLNIC